MLDAPKERFVRGWLRGRARAFATRPGRSRVSTPCAVQHSWDRLGCGNTMNVRRHRVKLLEFIDDHKSESVVVLEVSHARMY